MYPWWSEEGNTGYFLGSELVGKKWQIDRTDGHGGMACLEHSRPHTAIPCQMRQPRHTGNILLMQVKFCGLR
jgi:hypothetical protein